MINQNKKVTARSLAADVLIKIGASGQYSNIALDTVIKRSELSDADKALLSVLVYGVTERMLTLDYYVSKLTDRKLGDIDVQTLTALRIGLYQLIYLDRIPEHAAVNESVDISPQKSRGFVNAILRSYLRKRGEISLPDGIDAQEISVLYSVSPSLCRKLINIYGTDRTRSILGATFERKRINLRVNTLKISRDELKVILSGNGIECTEGVLDTDLDTDFGAAAQTGEFADGLFFIQDTASQLCVAALGAKPGMTVIDACACPGSKSFGTAVDMGNKGKIISCDLHENKLSLIRSGAQRLGIDVITTRAIDGRINCPEYKGIADAVLCDVPCSGFGVLSKKPEIRYKDISASENLPEIQYAILDNCSDYVRSGGTLIYSTCTVIPEENQNNVIKFLENHKEFKLTPFSVGGYSSDGMLTLLPDSDGTDGFFIAKLTRI